MSHRAKRLLHYVSLDGAGGVELQFADFVRRAQEAHQRDSTVVACGSSVHPLVADRLSPGLVHHREKYLGSFKLPKWPRVFRAAHQRRLVDDSAPDAVLIWNRLRDSLDTLAAAGPQRCIYWERGAAWFADVTPAKTAFIERIQAVLCNSHAARRMLELRWGYVGQSCVVPNALRDAVRPVNQPPRSAPGQPVWRLGVVARLESIKGVALALHALAGLHAAGEHATLDVAGDGPQRERLVALAEWLGIGHAVVFHGLVADMAGFYRRIDLLVHPALREPFGQIVIEAAAYGVPSVVTAVDGLVEVVDHGYTGLCLSPEEPVSGYDALGGQSADLPPYVYDPANNCLSAPRFVAPDRLAEAIIRLLSDTPRYAAFSAAGQVRVAADFGFEHHVAQALAAIDRYIAHGRLDSSVPAP